METVILLGAGSCEALAWQLSFGRNVLVESSVSLIWDCSSAVMSSKEQHFVIWYFPENAFVATSSVSWFSLSEILYWSLRTDKSFIHNHDGCLWRRYGVSRAEYHSGWIWVSLWQSSYILLYQQWYWFGSIPYSIKYFLKRLGEIEIFLNSLTLGLFFHLVWLKIQAFSLWSYCIITLRGISIGCMPRNYSWISFYFYTHWTKNVRLMGQIPTHPKSLLDDFRVLPDLPQRAIVKLKNRKRGTLQPPFLKDFLYWSVVS